MQLRTVRKCHWSGILHINHLHMLQIRRALHEIRRKLIGAGRWNRGRVYGEVLEVRAGPEKVRRSERREEALSVGPRGESYDSRLKRRCATTPRPGRRERARDGSGCTVAPGR